MDEHEILQESAWNAFAYDFLYLELADANPRSSPLLVLTFRKWLELESHFGSPVAV